MHGGKVGYVQSYIYHHTEDVYPYQSRKNV